MQRDGCGKRFALVFSQADAAALRAVGLQHALEIIQRAVADAIPLTGFQVDAEEGFQLFGAGPAGGHSLAGGKPDIIPGLFAKGGHQLLQCFALQRQEHIEAGLDLIVQAAVAGAAAQAQLFIFGNELIGVGRFGVKAQQEGPVLFQRGGGFPHQRGDGLGIVGIADRPAGGVGQGAPGYGGGKNDAHGGVDLSILLQIDLLADPTLFNMGPAAVLHQVAPGTAGHKFGIARHGSGVILLQDRHDEGLLFFLFSTCFLYSGGVFWGLRGEKHPQNSINNPRHRAPIYPSIYAISARNIPVL